MAGPQTITGLTLLQLSNLSYATLIVTDTQGNMAAGTTPFYQTPGGILLPGKADENGYPIHAAEGSAPQGSGTITVSSSNTDTTLSASVGSLAFGAGLFDAKQATVRLYNNGTSQTITAVNLSLSDTVGGQAVAVTYSQTVSLASGSTQAVVFPLTEGIGASATVSVTFGTAPTAGSVAIGVDWQSAGAANTAITAASGWANNSLSVPTGTATALPAHACRSIFLKAPTANTGTVSFGNASVQALTLSPGETFNQLPLNNTNLVYVIAATSGQTVEWGAV